MITRCARTCGACRGGLLGGAQRGIGGEIFFKFNSKN